MIQSNQNPPFWFFLLIISILLSILSLSLAATTFYAFYFRTVDNAIYTNNKLISGASFYRVHDNRIFSNNTNPFNYQKALNNILAINITNQQYTQDWQYITSLKNNSIPF